MLATVLRTKVASQMSIAIMRAFVTMRHYIGNNLIEQKYINNMVLEHDDKILEELLKLIKDIFNEYSKWIKRGNI